MSHPKTEMLFTRASPEVKRAFVLKAERNGRTTSDVLRELVTAWVDGRVVIQPHE